MYHAGAYPYGNVSDTEYRPAVVIKLNDIPVLDVPWCGVGGVNPHRMPVIAILQNAMPRNLAQPAGISVVVGMEGIPGVGE